MPEAPPVVAAPAPTDAAVVKEQVAAPGAEAPPVAPEDAAPLATISGYTEAGYDVNLTKNSYDTLTPLRAYDQSPGFKLRAAHLAVSHSFSSEASAFVSVDFGTDATYNNFNYAAGPTPVDIREGYVKWTPGDFALTAGKFVTNMGIEVVDGPLNPTITRGFLFWLAEPVGHTGAKALYSLGGGVAHIGAGIVNGWDRLLDNNNKKTILFNADVAPSAMFHAQISGAYGAEQDNVDEDDARLTLDLTGAFVFDSLTLNFQGLYGSEKFPGAETDTWYGLGLQPVFTADMFSLGGRIEYFHDKLGSRTGLAGEDQGLFNFTIAPGITPTKGLTFRAEYRIDAVLANSISKDVLTNGKSSQSTLALGASYSF
jgi:hypothetical protein